MSFAPIGIFDSGYGGLTVFKSITERLPQYDYIYLGDNARAPYGNRSFDTILQYTWQSVQWFYKQNCPLVILACNTASAKALRTIQQKYLASFNDPAFRVLGVIRPTAEVITAYTNSKHVGILATKGTVASNSYPIELSHQDESIQVYQQACPLWVPLVENNAFTTPAAKWIIEQDVNALMANSASIDTVLLACTHYPLIQQLIEAALPAGIQVINQGDIVAASLEQYLLKHTILASGISKTGARKFYTTDDAKEFNEHSSLFYGSSIHAEHVELPHLSF